MAFTIQLHDGPLNGQRKVIADDVLPPEVAIDGAAEQKLHYVRTGGAHNVNGGSMIYSYAHEPAIARP